MISDSHIWRNIKKAVPLHSLINLRIKEMNIKAALFDLDGVVFDTETQYTIFWSMIGKEYHPEIEDFAHRIKGQTLVQIYDKYFSDAEVFARVGEYTSIADGQAKITARLDDFEKNMKFEYIPGFEDFVKDLKAHGVKCAVVTSSNIQKMLNVYKEHPEFKGYFDRVLTSEDFTKSKPDPDCYLKGAACFDALPQECVGFEDSFNGLKAVRAAGVFTIGLATTNSEDAIKGYSDYVIDNYVDFAFADLSRIVTVSQ